MIVADASAILEVLFRTDLGQGIEHHLLAPDQHIHAPHLLDIEVAQVVRRYDLRGAMDSMFGRQVLSDFAEIRITRHGHGSLLPRVWELRQNLSAYDAVYVALAESLPATLLTTDRGMASVAARTVEVVLI